MSTAKPNDPFAPISRAELQAELAPIHESLKHMATKADVAKLNGMLMVMMWGGSIVGAVVLAAALKTLFGWG